MRGKKGDSSHIDWVISLGIFIVYILLLLTWIKPSYQPAFEQDVLLDIIQRGIEKDVTPSCGGCLGGFTWTVGKTLLKLTSCSITNGGFSLNIDDYIENLDSGLKVLKLDGTTIGYKDRLNVEVYSLGENDYWIFDSTYSNYGENGGDWENNIVEGCGIEVGETIVKKGLTGNLLNGMSINQINEWGFPNTREFKIIVTEIDKDPVTYSYYCKTLSGDILTSNSCENYNIDNNAVVYSREWRYNILDKDGNFEAILINILVW